MLVDAPIEHLKLKITKVVVREKRRTPSNVWEAVFNATSPTKLIDISNKKELASKLFQELQIYDISEKRFLKGCQYFSNKNLFKFEQFENRAGDYLKKEEPFCYKTTYFFKVVKG